jgi:hypothetical protein
MADASGEWLVAMFVDLFPGPEGSIPVDFASAEIQMMGPTPALMFAVRTAAHVPPAMWQELLSAPLAPILPVLKDAYHRWVVEYGEVWAKDLRLKAELAGTAFEDTIRAWAEVNVRAAETAGSGSDLARWNWVADAIAVFTGSARHRLPRVGFALAASDHLSDTEVDRLTAGFHDLLPFGSIAEFNREGRDGLHAPLGEGAR